MSRSALLRLAGLLCGAACLAGCTETPPEFEIPALNPSGAAAAAMAEFDTDHDGSIVGGEFDRAPGLKAALATSDADKNGILSQEEIANRIKVYADSGVSLVGFICQVRLDGHPLAGADVSFEPEAFQGPALKSAGGKTAADGMASLQIAGNQNHGLYYGMYRVKISKPDAAGKELLPPQYNLKTTLGQEVGPGVDMEHGVTFDLKSH